MSDDFVTALRAQVVQATAGYARRGRAKRLFRTVALLPRLHVVAPAAGLAVLLGLIAVSLVAYEHRTRPSLPHGPRLSARLTLAGMLGDSAQLAFGSVWLDDTERYQLLRVDPRTRRVVRRIHVPAEVTMAAAGDALWIAPRSSHLYHSGFAELLRVDPRTNRVTGRIALRTPSGGRFSGFGLGADPVHPTSLWIWGGDGALRLDTRSLQVTQAILPGHGATYVTDFKATTNSLWIATEDDRLLRYDRRSGTQRSATRLPRDGAAAVGAPRTGGRREFGAPAPKRILEGDGDGVVLSTGHGLLARVEAHTGTLAWRSAPIGPIQATAADQGHIWAVVSDDSRPRDRLVDIDARTGRLLTSTPVPDADARAIVPSASELWIPTPDGTVDIMAP